MVPVEHMPTSSLGRQHVVELHSFLALAAFSPPPGSPHCLVRAVAELLPAQRGQAGRDLLLQRFLGSAAPRSVPGSSPAEMGQGSSRQQVSMGCLGQTASSGGCVCLGQGGCLPLRLDRAGRGADGLCLVWFVSCRG